MNKTSISDLFVKEILYSPFRLILFSLLTQVFLVPLVICLSFQKNSSPLPHGSQAYLIPEDPLEVKGHEVYIQEGCAYCHTQSLRPSIPWEMKRFHKPEEAGHFPIPDPMESYFESPSSRGSRRIGPDLSRAAFLYTESELENILKNERKKDLKGSLHQYSYLFHKSAETSSFSSFWKIQMQLQLRVPLSDVYQRSFSSRLQEKTQGDALISYLLSRGKREKVFFGKYYVKE